MVNTLQDSAETVLPHRVSALLLPVSCVSLEGAADASHVRDDDFVAVKDSPSSLCDSRVWRKHQYDPSTGVGKQRPPFACFRPAVSPPHAFPAALVSPVFAQFLHDASAPCTGDAHREALAVARLVTEMPAPFLKEEERARAFRAILQPFLGETVRPLHPSGTASPVVADGCITARMSDDDTCEVLLYIEEDKVELGTGDPWFQGQAYYQRFWDTVRDAGSGDSGGAAALFERDARPALFLELVGPNLRVSALASLEGNRVLCEPLTPYLSLLAITGQPRALEAVAAALRALRNALGGLRAHYAEAVARLRVTDGAGGGGGGPQVGTGASAAAVGRRERGLPYPLRTGWSPAGPRAVQAPFPSLCRTRILSPPGNKLVYIAETTRTAPLGGSAAAEPEPEVQTVCVKFLPGTYPAAIHQSWSAAGLAPELIACVALGAGAGEFTMVVMEHLAPPKWRTLSSVVSVDARATATAAARRALAMAHALRSPASAGGEVAGYVHGDAREANILVRHRGRSDRGGAEEEGTGEWDVRFCDFDWSGVEGRDRYPLLMSEAIDWAPGARPGALLQQEHDTHFQREL